MDEDPSNDVSVAVWSNQTISSEDRGQTRLFNINISLVTLKLAQGHHNLIIP